MTTAFYVTGVPVPQGSMKCIGARGKIKHQLISDHAEELEDWRGRIVAAASRTYPGTGPVIRFAEYEPAMIEITYSLPRPQSHYGTGRNAGKLKDSAPLYPTKMGSGDVDKLERAVLDALAEAKVLHNDAQVTDVFHRKRYAGTEYPRPDVLSTPGAVIRLHPGGD